MGEKILIIIVLNFYSTTIITKGILILIIIVSYGVIAYYIKPYKNSDVYDVDANSTHVCAFTVLFAVFAYKNEFDYYIYISFILMFIVNLLFILSMLKKIVCEFLPKTK